MPQGEGLEALLLACHARIRSFLRLALTLGARVELDPRDDAVRCLRYFTEALPLHVEDEEASLTPRLLGRSASGDAALAQMRSQHFEHRRGLDELKQALQGVILHPFEPFARKPLLNVASRLETDFTAHLVLEETTLFPLINRELSPELQGVIVAELRARRARGLRERR